MPEPRLLFLSNSPAWPDQELPPGFRDLGDRIDPGPERGIEVAPGVRVALVRTGSYLLPSGETGYGAVIAVWTEKEKTDG